MMELRGYALPAPGQCRDGFSDQALHRDVVVMRCVGPAEFDDHEQVCFFSDPETRLRAIVARRPGGHPPHMRPEAIMDNPNPRTTLTSMTSAQKPRID